MADTNLPGTDWLLIFTSPSVIVPEGFHLELDAIRDVGEREQALNVREGTPILVAPDFGIDPLLVDFFALSDFAARSKAGRATYAREIKTWCAFLWARQMRWNDASELDFNDFKRWRTDPGLHVVVAGEVAPVVAGATFMKARFALDSLYRWALARGHVVASAIPAERQVGRGQRRPHGTNVQGDRAKWVTPATYRAWREVGLGGYLARREGSGIVPADHDRSWRGGQDQTRNEAFCDLMITSALRRAEQSSLVLAEVPVESDGVGLASAVAKYGKSRMYTPLPGALEKVQAYVRGGRVQAVGRAQQAQRYEEYARTRSLLVLAGERVRGRDLVLEFESGPPRRLGDLDVDARLRLFRRDGKGRVEPVSVWLSNSGMPMLSGSWNLVFRRANARVGKECERLGMPLGRRIWLSPHSLRFSFALYVLAALHRRIDEREGYRDSGEYVESRYEQAYDVVRDLLGHSQVATTKNTYLEPVKGLRRSLLFDGVANQDLDQVISRLTAGSDLVLDTATAFESRD